MTRIQHLTLPSTAVSRLVLKFVSTITNKALHASASRITAMSVETDPAERLKYVLSGSLVAFPSAALALGLLTSPVLYWSLQREAAVAGAVAVTALAGWSLYLGRRVVFGESPDLPEGYADLDWRLRAAITVLGIVYYNLVLLVTVWASVQLAAVGFAFAGAVLAFVYPAYDVASTERGVPLSISGAFMLVTYAVLDAWDLPEDVSTETARVDRLVVDLVGGRGRRGPG